MVPDLLTDAGTDDENADGVAQDYSVKYAVSTVRV